MQHRLKHPVRLKMLAFGCLALLLTISTLSRPLYDAGDAHEYLQMLQAWRNHASPDLRPQDAQEVGEMLRFPGMAPDYYKPFLGFFPDRNGLFYCWHFWLYSLAAVPAKMLLSSFNLPEINAFYWTNLVLLLLSAYVVLFHSALSEAKRWMLVGLATLSPVLWYVNWMHPEAFCWSLVMLAVAAFTARRYAWGAFCVALASWQNPQLAFVSFFAVVLAMHAALQKGASGNTSPEPAMRQSARVEVVATLVATALCFVPPLFYQWHYGWSNLILREQGFPSARFITWSKVWSALFDLNQGLLAYVPLLLMLAGAALFVALKERRWKVLGIFVTLILMIVATTSSPVWVSATAGLQRYSVWMLPLWAWLIVEVLPDTRLLRGLVVAAVFVQAVIVASDSGEMDHQKVKPLARLVWDIAPAQYNPEFMIFQQRVTGTAHPRVIQNFPLFYVRPDGNVTKILTDAPGLNRFKEKFTHVDATWLASIRSQYKTRNGLFYLHPPIGAVQR